VTWKHVGLTNRRQCFGDTYRLQFHDRNCKLQRGENGKYFMRKEAQGQGSERNSYCGFPTFFLLASSFTYSCGTAFSFSFFFDFISSLQQYDAFKGHSLPLFSLTAPGTFSHPHNAYRIFQFCLEYGSSNVIIIKISTWTYIPEYHRYRYIVYSYMAKKKTQDKIQTNIT